MNRAIRTDRKGRQLITGLGGGAGRVIALLAFTLLLASCTAVKLGYENLPRLIQWQADRFLSLDSAQENLVNRHARSLQQWHRQNLLPVYADFLRRVEEEMRNPVTASQVAEWRRTVVEAWVPIADRLAPAVAELGVTLRPEQIAHLREVIAKTNDKAAREYRPADPAKRQEARFKRLVNRAESFLGDPGEAQRQEMRQSAASMAQTEDVWWQARLARQAVIVDLLDDLSSNKPEIGEATRRARVALAGLFSDQGPTANPAAQATPVNQQHQSVPVGLAQLAGLRRQAQAAAAAGDELTARLLALATPEQRRRAITRLGDYRQDFQLLAAR